MTDPRSLAKTESGTLPQTNSRWVGILTSGEPTDFTTFHCQRVAGENALRKLYVRHEMTSTPPSSAERAGCGVIFDGVLYDRPRWERELGELLVRHAANDAEVVLAAYQKWGETILSRLRGAFALVIWDSRNETFLCLRDPTGIYPMFYTEVGDDLIVSNSMDVLIRQPRVSAALNSEALSDFFLDRFPMMDETFFATIKRVPPGHVLRIARDGRLYYRYWDPAPNGKVEWLSAEEVEQFDELLDQAVRRPLSLGPAGILLSGGLDSVSVAAGAVQCAQAYGVPKPLALSLVFPEADVNEEIVQRGVASQLGLSQVLKGFWEAAGKRGLLAGAVELNSSLPAPIINTWWPAYNVLVGEGHRRGCRVILTGTGGDEWLGIAPVLAADLIRELDFAGVYRLWTTSWRSFRNPRIPLLRSLLWTFALGPLVTAPAHKLVQRTAPWALRLRRRIFTPPPKWLAPDGALRKRLQERWEQKSLRETHADSSGSFYLREMKISLDHPLTSWELEEQFEFSRIGGVRIAHPLWDPDLVDMLYRTPPFMLIHNGRAKGLVRASLARRFPDLGFEQQRKVAATRFYSSVIYKEAEALWNQLQGAPTLAALGVVDGKRIGPSFHYLLRRRKHGDAHRAWTILNLESWARAHAT